MAPLRSSRHTRHHDPNTTTRAGRAATDFDPTDGLPVRRFILESVSINQDASAEATDPNNNASANKAGGATNQGSTPNAKDAFPWPEQPLPPFFDQLPPHNQELLRRARAGERESKASVWDRKAHEWVRYDEARKRGLTGESGMRKSRYLMAAPNEDGEDANAGEDNDDDDASDDGSEEEGGDAAGGAGGSGDAQTATAAAAANGNGAVVPPKGKKRKVPPTQLLQDRTFDVKKWTQVPFDKADKMPEAKYLADRRPGMGNFYNQSAQGAWAQAQGYGVGDGGAGHGAGYDLGDGSGLGNAMGGQGQPGTETPVRKNMPPRPRKKKGGPGRKKKEVVEAERRAAEEARRKAEAAERGETLEGDGEAKEMAPGTVDGKAGSETPRSKKEGDASGDDSEVEGSEEGEVNDSGASSAVGTPSATTTSAPMLGLGLNAPAVPSSLSREVASVDDTTLPDAGPPEEETEAPSTTAADTLPPPQVDAQMTDASETTDAIPPPAAEPTVPETIVEAPTASPLSGDAGDAGVGSVDSPTVPDPNSADVNANPAPSAPEAAGDENIAPAPTIEPEAKTEISVPFDPAAAAAAGEATPPVPQPQEQGIDDPAAAATAAPGADVPSPPPGAASSGLVDDAVSASAPPTTTLSNEEAAVREAAVQGEAREFARVEAVADPEDVAAAGGVEKAGATETGNDVGDDEQNQKAAADGDENQHQDQNQDGEGDLLGGLEREVDAQQGGA